MWIYSICYLSHLTKLIFAYSFRDKVVDFHWNASDPWTIVSVSDDCGSTGGGGTLQVSDSLFLLFRLNHKSA